jgi:type 1 glutamine amidotransferase
MRFLSRLLTLLLLASPLIPGPAEAAEPKRIVLLAGSRSHGKGEHEFRAGALLLAHCLNQVPGVQAQVVSNGWPSDLTVFDSASAVLIYADGGDGHPTIKPERLKVLDALAARGVGIGAAHYGVEVPTGDPGFAMLRWTGGYFEKFWSVNPTWTAEFKSLPNHPITRGVKPFSLDDEWYYHMRFVPEMKGITPILATVPPATTLNRPDGPHSGNPWVRSEVARGEAQTVMWAFERPTGGRGFGFTGGHYHRNWAQGDFRKLVLNALLWSAGVEVPSAGVEITLSPTELAVGLDAK